MGGRPLRQKDRKPGCSSQTAPIVVEEGTRGASGSEPSPRSAWPRPGLIGRAGVLQTQGKESMRAHRAMKWAIAFAFCVVVLLLNVQCGEYLLLHYLFAPEYPVVTSDELSHGPARWSEDQTEETDCGIRPVYLLTPWGTQLNQPEPPPPVPQPSCLRGDLNDDGTVDGRDIRVLLDCLLDPSS
ncbi:MAG: hypothetical protein V3S01_02130 [Dehalococcoidia bacterium]